MSAHDPGPWFWRKCGEAYELVTQHSGQLVVLGCDLSPGGRKFRPRLQVRDRAKCLLIPLAPDHPNARLIEVAPELLAAAEWAIAAVRVLRGMCETVGLDLAAGRSRELLDELERVTARARAKD